MMIQGVEQEAYTYARAYRSLWNDRGSYQESVANHRFRRFDSRLPRSPL